MSTKLYTFEGQISALPAEKVAAIFADCEQKLRSTGYTYVPHRAFPPQVDELATSWPENVRAFFREKTREFAGTGNAVTAAHIRKGMLATGEFVAGLRSKASGRSLDSEMAQMACEIAMATIFRRAPEAATGANIPVARKYQENGRMIRVKPAITSSRLFVNHGEMESADIYVLGLYVDALKVAYLLGFATKDQVKAAKPEEPGQKFIQIPLEKLQPMSAIYKEAGLKELPAGISMEAIPQSKSIPIVLKRELQSMLPSGNEIKDFDMLADLGIKPAAPQKQQPAQTEANEL